ncbi:MAG: transporter substrate-binding domain-containing protein [Pseudomonadales bacterium]|nr:transporter substrate-binding domain-containing protein [Pseudomonadales bacterium]
MTVLVFAKRLLPLLLMLTLSNVAGANSCDSLNVNGGQNWFPFFDRNNQDRYGILGDVVFQAAERQGIQLTLTPAVSWKRLLFDLKNGKLDIVAGALKTKKREKLFLYSNPVYYTSLNLYVRSDNQFTFEQPADLNNKRGLRIRGMSLGQEMDRYAFDHLILEETTDTSSLFKMVAAGRVDYGIFYLHSGLRELKRIRLKSKLVPLPNPIAKEPIYVAFSKTSNCQAEIQRLSQEIDRMLQDGSIERIVSSYIKPDINHDNNLVSWDYD